MESIEFFRNLVPEIPGATLGKMFGAEAIKMPNGKAGAMCKDDKLLVKIFNETLDDALRLKGVQKFTPMEGRPMGEWYEIPFEHKKYWKKFIEISCADVAVLEPNKKKK